MAQLNAATKPTPIFTAEGAPAVRITPLQELIRLTIWYQRKHRIRGTRDG